MSVALDNLKRDMRIRSETDEVISVSWLVIILVLEVIGIILIFSSALAPPVTMFPAAIAMAFLGWVPLVLAFIISLVLMYKLIKRRNTHFKRQALLFEDIVDVVRGLAEKKDVDVGMHINSCERIVREAKAEETEKSAVLWIILSLITFIASLYVYYFLMKDFYKHERREDFFWEDVGKALNTCGVTISMPRRMVSIPDRSFVLYLILSIITFGIFGIYWLYVLIKDPNEHFKYHISAEDELLKQLEAAITKES